MAWSDAARRAAAEARRRKSKGRKSSPKRTPEEIARLTAYAMSKGDSLFKAALRAQGFATPEWKAAHAAKMAKDLKARRLKGVRARLKRASQARSSLLSSSRREQRLDWFNPSSTTGKIGKITARFRKPRWPNAAAAERRRISNLDK